MIQFAAAEQPLHKPQSKYRKRSEMIGGYFGGRGSGKSFIGSWDMLRRARANAQYMCVTPTYPILEQATWPMFEQVARSWGLLIQTTKSPNRQAIIRSFGDDGRLDGGKATVFFRTGEFPDRLVGGNLNGAWFDEAGLLHRDCFLYMIPALRGQGRAGWLSMTGTPKGKRHWTYETFFDEQGIRTPNTFLIQTHSMENPWLPKETYEEAKRHYSSAMAEQELGGQFIEIAGLMFERDWFNIVTEVPVEAYRIRYWDKAATEKEKGGAYTCGVLMARTLEGIFFVEDVIRGKWSPLQRDKVVLQTADLDARRYGNSVQIKWEQEPGSDGKTVSVHWAKMLQQFPATADIVSGGLRWKKSGAEWFPGAAKMVRAGPLAAQAEAGNIRIKRARWNQDWLDEIAAFPESAYADQVDASSGAFNRIVANAFSATIKQPESLRYPAREPMDRGIRMVPDDGNGGRSRGRGRSARASILKRGRRR